MKNTFIILVLYISIGISHAQEISSIQWIKQFGSKASQIGTSVAVVPSGGVITTGSFKGNTEQYPRVYGQALFSAGEEDIAITGIDQYGAISWTKRIGGSFNDRGNAIIRDASGNIIITGYFEDTVDFDPGAGVFNLISKGNKDIFICKLNGVGGFLWAKSIGGDFDDIGKSISRDNLGNLYITGIFKDTVDFNTNGGGNELISKGGDDIFVLKLSSLGNFKWAKSFGGINDDCANSIMVNGTAEIYTVGNFLDTVDFDPNIGVFNLNSVGSKDIFISKSDSAGNFIWANSIGGNGADDCLAIAKDNSGNIYTTGKFTSAVNFNPVSGPAFLNSTGGTDIFVLKMSSAGIYVWAKKMGGLLNDLGTSIDVDPSGNPIVSGYFEGTSDFNPSASINNLVSKGDKDIFICKLSNAGNFRWVKQMGGLEGDLANDIKIYGAKVFCTGIFKGMADFDPGVTGTYYFIGADTSQFIVSIDTLGYLYGFTQNHIGSKTGYGQGMNTSHYGYRTLKTDSLSNVYSVGEFKGVIDADPGPGLTQMISTAYGMDAFFCKFDALGNFIWAKQLRSTQRSVISEITLDRYGDIYVCGSYSGTIDCDPGLAVYNLVCQDSILQESRPFMIKFNSNGDFIWALSLDGHCGFGGPQIDDLNNIYISGGFSGTIDFNPGIGIFNLTPQVAPGENSDMFVLKLDANGNFIWAVNMGGLRSEFLITIKLDDHANIYGTGTFYADADFDPGAGVYNLPCLGTNDMFVFKLDSAGNLITAKSIGKVNEIVNVADLHIDTSGDILVTGFATGIIDLDPGPGIINAGMSNEEFLYISKFDTVLNLKWTKVLFDPNGAIYPTNIESDDDGSIYVTGHFYSTIDFDPGPGIYNLTATVGTGFLDAFLLKLDSLGNFIWATKMGGVNFDNYHAIALRNKDIYVNGTISGNVVFNSGTGNYNLSAMGMTDYVICKFRSCTNSSATLNVNNCEQYYFNGSHIYNSGVYHDTIANTAGCDSIITLNLTIDPVYHYTETYSLCNGQLYNWHGQIISSSGTYYDNQLTAAGCDSTFTLTVNSAYIFVENMNICNGQTYNWHGNNYSTQGIYYDSLYTLNGCDSVFTLNLAMNTSYQLAEYYTLCNGQSYNWHGQNISSPGIYYDNQQTINLCDSNYTLTVITPTISIEDINICSGQNLTWNGNNYSLPGTYYDTLMTSGMCDSIVTLNLSISPNFQFTENYDLCNGETYSWHGLLINSGGIYHDSLNTSTGCDSIFQLNLTVTTVDNSVTVLGSVINANATNAVYQWLDCNNLFSPIIGETSQSFSAINNGEYAVEIVQGNCIDTSACIDITLVGIEIPLSSDFFVNPNPFTDELFLEAKGSENETNFELFNSLGEVIEQGCFKGKKIINLSELAKGVYFIKFHGLSSNYVKRVIKN